jgi:hypothetical protein
MNLLLSSQDALPWAPAMALWAVLMLTAWQHSRATDWLAHLPHALLAGAGTTLVALQLLPPGPPPGLAEWGYALPAPKLAQLAALAGVTAGAWAWPLLALRRAWRSR